MRNSYCSCIVLNHVRFFSKPPQLTERLSLHGVTSNLTRLYFCHANFQILLNDSIYFILFFIKTDYAKKIMHKAVVLCQQGDKTSKQLHPQLMCKPGPLTSTFTRPEKDAAVAGFVSRFAKITQPVGRQQPTPGQEEPPGGSQTVVGPGKTTTGVQVKGKRKKEVEQHVPPKRTKRKTAKTNDLVHVYA